MSSHNIREIKEARMVAYTKYSIIIHVMYINVNALFINRREAS